MIVTEKKNFEKIKEILANSKNIFLVGCGECATSCLTGGEKEVNELKEKLEKEGKKITGLIIIDAPCDERLIKKELPNIKSQIDKSDCVLCLGCGSGTSALSNFIDIPVFPGLDTLFLGIQKRLGKYYERCSLCGECGINATGGICPITTCPKNLLNGPCGDVTDSKCPVNQKDCGWAMIYNRLKKQNRLDNLKSYKPPKAFLAANKPHER